MMWKSKADLARRMYEIGFGYPSLGDINRESVAACQNIWDDANITECRIWNAIEAATGWQNWPS